jgi:hypothetical protein
MSHLAFPGSSYTTSLHRYIQVEPIISEWGATVTAQSHGQLGILGLAHSGAVCDARTGPCTNDLCCNTTVVQVGNTVARGDLRKYRRTCQLGRSVFILLSRFPPLQLLIGLPYVLLEIFRVSGNLK